MRPSTGGAAGEPDPNSPSCGIDPGPARDLPRLSFRQYAGVLRDGVILSLGGDAANADAVLAEIAPALAAVPADEMPKLQSVGYPTFRRVGQDVTPDYVRATYDVAVAVGKSLSRADRLPKVMGNCERGKDCIRSMIERIGSRLFRRPLLPEEIDLYVRAHGGEDTIDATGVADVIAALISAGPTRSAACARTSSAVCSRASTRSRLA